MIKQNDSEKWKGEYNDFIGIYHNIIDSDLCNKFIEFYEWAISNQFGTASWEPGFENQAHGSERRDTTIYSPVKFIHNDVYRENFPNEITSKYFEILNHCLNEFIIFHSLKINYALKTQIYKLHKVRPSEGFHKWHCEHDPISNPTRMMAFMTYLQIPEEGGETEFLHQSLRIKPEIGTTLIWPAHFTHAHRGNPPLKGNKIYVTGWFHGVQHLPEDVSKL